MRIEIDKDLASLLDEIKQQEHIYGRGHTDTVRFLATYYKTHKQLQELFAQTKRYIHNFLDNLDQIIESSLERVILKASANALTTLLELADEKQPVSRQRAADQDPGGVR